MATMTGNAELRVRWTAGVIAITATRLLLEHRLPGGAALGIGFALFMFLWLPTVPASAYEPGSPLRGLLYRRFGWFILAVIVSGIAYNLVIRAAA